LKWIRCYNIKVSDENPAIDKVCPRDDEDGGTIYRYCAILISLVVVLSFCLGGCEFDDPARVTTATPIRDMPGSSAGVTVYFTDPDSPTARTYRGGPDKYLAEAIDQAKLSVDVAIYDFNLWSLRDALVEAHRRGVSVRVVAESDNLDRSEIQELAEAGIPVLGDRREGRMHNKFVVIDRQEVWTGSMNFTVSEAYQNNNNLLHVRSSRMAENYLVEFEEMFVEDRFGPGSPSDTPRPTLTVDGVQLEVYFSPDDGTAERLVELISQADESVYFMAYSFTSDEIAAALLDQVAAGVTVAGVFDASQVRSNTGTEFDHLLSEGAIVRLDGNPEKMHHKVIIIDEEILITGSYNFSASAEEKNDENTLVIHSPNIAAEYLQEFEKVFMQAKD
jgi:phosphatidylserine/phosphatidylglycerophosphate/cardiolipin synthase-like enzyme